VILLAGAGAAGCAVSGTPRAGADAAVAPEVIDAVHAPEALRSDLREIVALHERRCPDPYLRRDRESIAAVRDRLEASITRPMSRREFHALVMELQAAYGIDHLAQSVPSEDLTAAIERGDGVVPFRAVPDGDALLVVAVGGSVPDLEPGDRIISMNGRPAAWWIERLCALVPGESERFRMRRIANSFRSLAWALHVELPAKVQIVRADGSSATLLLKGAGADARHGERTVHRRSPERDEHAVVVSMPPFSLRFVDGDIAVMDFPTMDGSRRQEFERFLDEAFTQIRRRNCAGLVVDIRENGGGNSTLGELLLARLTDRPYRLVAGLVWRKGDGGPDERRTADAVSRSRRAPGFDGPAYLLIGEGTFSSAMMLADAVRTYDLMVSIGESTGGVPTSLGEIALHSLPESGIRVHACSKLFIRASGDMSDLGPVRPHIDVAEAAGRDAPLERAIAEVRRRASAVVAPGAVQDAAGNDEGGRIDADAATTVLLEGVDEIASAGVPGPLAVLGPDAFAIVAGRLDRHSMLPVVAGASCGAGRVIAFGHGGMIGADALRSEGTRRLAVNALRWLAHDELAQRSVEGGAPIRAMVVDNPSIAAVLDASGAVACSQVPRRDWSQQLARLAPEVLIVDSHWIGDADRPIVDDLLHRGGGLLTAGLGWGWLQLNPGREIHDHPGNRLLVGCGLAWCDGTLEATGPGVFATRIPLGRLHALTAMQALEQSLRENAAFSAQSAATLTAALRVAPSGHALLERAQRAASERGGAAAPVAPAQGRPIRAKDAAARALLGIEIELERRASPEAVAAHASAVAFPGTVPAEAPRVARRVTIDLAVPGWHSTGLYAPPGETVSAEVHGAFDGGRIRVGAHSDTLWHLEKWERAPDIVRSWPIPVGASSIRVASAFGGLIYIEVPRRGQGSVEVEIEGAVEAPHFVLGRTSAEQWLAARAAPAPWGEMESSKVIVTVPSAVLRSLDDPAAVMQFWDRISDAHATLAMIPLEPERPHRFVADLQISAGYMHSGYPIMTHLDAAKSMTDLESLRRGSWGLLHELGHNHQQGDWTFDGTVEVTCNLFSLHAIDTICSSEAGDRGHPGVNAPPSLEAHLAAGAPFDAWKRDPFLALHMYVQLQREFGWQTFQRVFAEYRSLPRDERPRNDDEKRDQWMVRFSRACGRNLGAFFEAWGVPTSQAARASIADLPAWMPTDWPTPASPQPRAPPSPPR